jgi:hypothetical protein
MILYEFRCLYSCYVILYIKKSESPVEIVNRCIPWKIPNGVKNIALNALQFEEVAVCLKFPGVANTV